jgi:hypothetical protein
MKENGTSPPKLRSSTPAKPQFASLADARKSMKKDEEVWTKQYSTMGKIPQVIANERRMLEFLYGREFESDASPEVRVKRMIEFIADRRTKWRFRQVLNDSEQHMDRWLYNQILVLLYGKLRGANTIFMGREIALVYRVQSSRNCYLHSVATLLGYKLAWSKARNGYVAVSVDVGKYVRSCFDNEMLYNRVVKNEGAYTKQCVVAMAGEENVEYHCIRLCRDGKGAFLASELAELGPAVISNFQADEFFHASFVLPEEGSFVLPQFDTVDAPAAELKAMAIALTTADASGKVNVFKHFDLGKPTDNDTSLAHDIMAKYTPTSVVPCLAPRTTPMALVVRTGWDLIYWMMHSLVDLFVWACVEAFFAGEHSVPMLVAPSILWLGYHVFLSIFAMLLPVLTFPLRLRAIRSFLALTWMKFNVDNIMSATSEDDSPSLVTASSLSTCEEDEASTLYPDESDNDEADGKDLGNHSMLIIGYREEVQGTQKKYWFLIQNSWKRMCLAEVSSAYLAKHVKGEYIFISKPLEDTTKNLRFVEGLAVECAFPDGGDGVFDDSQMDGNI